MRDPYEVLGVTRSASATDIKSAFRRLAKKLHPDANKHDPRAAARFAELNAAYEILGEEDFKKFQQISADTVETAESTLYRFAPDMSNPPDEVAKVAAGFWRPKATMAATTKPKAATMEPTAAKEPTKKP